MTVWTVTAILVVALIAALVMAALGVYYDRKEDQ